MTMLPTPPPMSGSPVSILAKLIYWDLVQAWVNEPLNAKDRQYLRRNCGSITVWTDKRLPEWRIRLVIFQPNAKALRFLDKKFGKNVLINRIESSVDLITADAASAKELKLYFDRHGIQKNRRSRKLGGYGTTSYWCQERWVTRQLVMYVPPNGSKLDPRSRPCTHFEIRVSKARAVRGSGVHRFRDLVGFDHRRLWLRTVDLSAVDLAGLGRANRYADGDKRRNVHGDADSGASMALAARQFDDAGQPRRADITTQEIIDAYRDDYGLRTALVRLDRDWLLPDPKP